MSTSVNFERRFLIFDLEDDGFGTLKKPSGYVRIEVRDSDGKLDMFVKNLKDNDGDYYMLYLLCEYNDEVKGVHAGNFKPSNGNANLKWIFNPLNVGESGKDLNSFDTALVVAHKKSPENNRYPLVACKNKSFDWKSFFNKEKEKNGEDIEKAPEPAEDFSGHEQEKNLAASKDEKPEEAFEKEDAPEEEEPMGMDIILKPEEGKDDLNTEEFVEENIYSADGEENNNTDIEKNIEKKDYSDIEDKDYEDLDTEGKCIYGDDETCQKEEDEEVNPCEDCYEKKTVLKQAVPSDGPADIDKLVILFDRHFERVNPFESRRSDYTWWKVNNPVYLNDLLYQCDIKAPLLFNPSVMRAHYRYRYLIAGLYKDVKGKRTYLACGIPGNPRRDRSPFGSLCKFVVEGRRNKRSLVLGYWLVYIDPLTGGPLKIIDS